MNLSSNLLKRLSAEYGDCFYLYDLQAFARNYRVFSDAFKAVYSNTSIAYSYKTNYTPALCKLVDSWGGYAEVVSRLEFDLARQIGVDPRRIIFNGPIKSYSDLKEALLEGSLVNLDGFSQIEDTRTVAEKFPDRKFKVGLRVNLERTEARSRFGFARLDVSRQAKLLEASGNVEVVALHCHLLTPQRSPSDYQAMARSMLEISHDIGGIRTIDLGGGFYSPMKPELASQFIGPIPSFSDYAKAVGAVFSEPAGGNPSLELILEPGIAITATMAYFATRVIDVRTIGERHLATVSGSIYNIKPMRNRRNLPVSRFSESQPKSEGIRQFDIVGYTCMEDDVLFSGYTGELMPGDFLVFENVGAYTNVLKPPFIAPCPPILSLDAAGEISVLKRQETIDDVFQCYIR